MNRGHTGADIHLGTDSLTLDRGILDYHSVAGLLGEQRRPSTLISTRPSLN